MNDKELEYLVGKYQAEQRVLEVIWFYRLCENIKPSVIVEIGIKEGGNLKILSTLLPSDGLAIGIDPRQEIPWKMNDCECKTVHIKKPSGLPETISDVRSVLGGRSIDVLFIDGDHSYEGMLSDYNIYSPLVRKGGIIAVHDIYYLEGVAKAWNHITSGKEKIESTRIQSSIGIGVLYKE